MAVRQYKYSEVAGHAIEIPMALDEQILWVFNNPNMTISEKLQQFQLLLIDNPNID